MIWNFDTPYLSEPYGSAALAGFAVAFVPDLNQGGFDDVLIGDHGDGQSYSTAGTGRVYVLDGLRGTILREHTGQLVGSMWGEYTGSSLLGVVDVDGDGAGDYVIGSPNSDLGQANYDRRGLVTLYSGRTGVPLWSLGGQFDLQDFGGMLALGPDFDLDGHREILCGTTTYSTSGIWLVSPMSGIVIHTMPELFHSSGIRSPCFAVTSIDLNGDGMENIVGSAPSGGNYQGAGMVTAWDTITEQVIWSYESLVDWEDFGHSLAPLDDLDLDGVPEVLAGVPTATGHNTNKGYAAVLSGRDGSLLQRFTTQSFNQPWIDNGLLVRPYGSNGRRNMALIQQSTLNDEEGIHVVQFQPYLSASRTTVSAAAGASVVYELDFPASEAGSSYALLASASGRGPTTIGGLSVPLTADGVLARTLAGQYLTGFTRPRGSLDGQGRALAALLIAPAGGSPPGWDAPSTSPRSPDRVAS